MRPPPVVNTVNNYNKMNPSHQCTIFQWLFLESWNNFWAERKKKTASAHLRRSKKDERSLSVCNRSDTKEYIRNRVDNSNNKHAAILKNKVNRENVMRKPTIWSKKRKREGKKSKKNKYQQSFSEFFFASFSLTLSCSKTFSSGCW